MLRRSATHGGGAARLAGLLCVVEASMLAGLALFYAYELVVGGGSSAVRVLVSGALIVGAAVALAALGRGWLRGAVWARSPTLAWNLLLLPVGFTLTQADGRVLGAVVLVVALTSLVAALLARPADDPVSG